MSTESDQWRVQQTTVGGRSLEYIDVGSGPVLLLVHGTGGACSFWQQNLAELAQTFRVIAPSLPGCGRSARLSSTPVDLLPYADALAGLLDELGIRSAIVLGHSLGGLVALRFALTYPDRVTRLVMVDSGGAPLGRVRLATVTRALLVVRALCSRPGFVQFILDRPRLRQRMMSSALVNPSAMTADAFAEGLRSFGVPGVVDSIRAGTSEQGMSSAEWLTVPTTVIWGRLDQILPVRLGAQLAEDAPGARLEIVDQAGHAPMLDQPDAFADVLRRQCLTLDPGTPIQS